MIHSKYKLGAAAIILNEQGSVLLVKHSYGHLNWELPGGGNENGESIVETVLREVYEETGLRVVDRHTTGVYYEPETGMHHFIFYCQPQDGTFNDLRIDNNEITEYAFWPPDALPRPISDFTVRRIEDGVSGVILPLPTVIATRQWFD